MLVYMDPEQFRGKNVAVFGFGKEGKSTLEFLRTFAHPQKIFIYDKNPIAEKDYGQNIYFFDGEERKNIVKEQVNIIFRSPGVSIHNSELVACRSRGAQVVSQIQLLLAAYGKKCIGVTGTKGKSTTVSIIAQVLKRHFKKVATVGNIGTPPFSVWNELNEAEIIVCELSSFQLIDITASPHIAVMQNIVPAHLDVHPTMGEYIQAKKNITAFQSENDIYLYCLENPLPREISLTTKAQTIGFSLHDPAYQHIKTRLEGEFNKVNIIPALVIGRLLGVPDEDIRKGIEEFKPLPHRLEHVGVFKGIEFIEDSIGTVSEATIQAIRTFAPRLHTLITGGYDSGQDYHGLAQEIIKTKTLKTVILFPQTGKIIHALLKGKRSDLNIFEAESMEEAVKLAYRHTPLGKNHICLLSCGAPSFGLFKDYVDRAQQYVEWVKTFGA